MIELSEEDPEIFQRVLNFLYKGNYSDGRTNTTEKELNASEAGNIYQGSLLINTRVYVCAEKWDVVGLKKLAVEKFREVLCTTGISASFVTSLSIMHSELPESDGELKKVAMVFVCESYHELARRSDFLDLFQRGGEIAVEIMKAIATLPENRPKQAMNCARCLAKLPPTPSRYSYRY